MDGLTDAIGWMIREHFIWFLVLCAVIAFVITEFTVAVSYLAQTASAKWYAWREREKYREGRWT